MELQHFVISFANQFEDTEVSEICENTNFQDIDEWDSLMILTIIAWAKTNFNKSITAIEIRSCKTVTDLYELINSK